MRRTGGWRSGRTPRQRRAFVVGGGLLATAVVMLLAAWRSGGFLSDLLLNLGASVVLAAISYVIFDPLFEESRKARVQEHLSFDQEAFVARLGRCRRVRVLDTWTILLDDQHRRATLDAIEAALRNGAEVQLLLLDPDCTAAQQRSEELERQGVDVPGHIRANLRHLMALRKKIGENERFEVRVYDASPSIQLYQWDGRSLISFFPVGKLSFNVPQLEVDMGSPLGGFVHARFEELWDHDQATVPLERYDRLAVTLGTENSDYLRAEMAYVEVDGEHYIDCERSRPNLSLTARAPLPRTPGSTPRVFTLIEPTDEERDPVARRFDEKYGPARGERAILRLTPR